MKNSRVKKSRKNPNGKNAFTILIGRKSEVLSQHIISYSHRKNPIPKPTLRFHCYNEKIFSKSKPFKSWRFYLVKSSEHTKHYGFKIESNRNEGRFINTKRSNLTIRGHGSESCTKNFKWKFSSTKSFILPCLIFLKRTQSRFAAKQRDLSNNFRDAIYSFQINGYVAHTQFTFFLIRINMFC